MTCEIFIEGHLLKDYMRCTVTCSEYFCFFKVKPVEKLGPLTTKTWFHPLPSRLQYI
jgi:hypothetical protein